MTARARTPNGKLRRVGRDRLVDLRSLPPPVLDYTNVEQWESINDAVALLFYTETDDDVLFDPNGDARLLELHTEPFAFDNDTGLAPYVSLIQRAQYRCKPHPNQVLAREQAALELGIAVDDLLIMVYRRDAASTSAVRRRERAPFTNTTNGLGTGGAAADAVPLVLFREKSFDPYASVVLVWHHETHINASIGLVGFRIETLFG